MPPIVKYEYRFTSEGTKENPDLGCRRLATETAGDWADTETLSRELTLTAVGDDVRP